MKSRGMEYVETWLIAAFAGVVWWNYGFQASAIWWVGFLLAVKLDSVIDAINTSRPSP